MICGVYGYVWIAIFCNITRNECDVVLLSSITHYPVLPLTMPQIMGVVVPAAFTASKSPERYVYARSKQRKLLIK